MENYQKITKTLVWIVITATIAYFVLLPVSFTRPNPQVASPPQKVKNTLRALSYPGINEFSTTSQEVTSTIELPNYILPVSE